MPLSKESLPSPYLKACITLCQKVSSLLDTIIRIPITLTLIALVAIVGYSVVARYVFSSPPTWTEEVSLFLIIAVVFISLRVTFRQGQQIGITFFIDRLPRFSRYFVIISYIATFFFMSIVTIQSYNFAVFFAMYKAPATGISFYWLYLGVSIGCALTCLEILLMFIQECCTLIMQRQQEQ